VAIIADPAGRIGQITFYKKEFYDALSKTCHDSFSHARAPGDNRQSVSVDHVRCSVGNPASVISSASVTSANIYFIQSFTAFDLSDRRDNFIFFEPFFGDLDLFGFR
jgi:hypothetical protein